MVPGNGGIYIYIIYIIYYRPRPTLFICAAIAVLQVLLCLAPKAYPPGRTLALVVARSLCH